MKITMVLGSPRLDSISSKMAMRFAEGARENGHEIVTYNINEMDVMGCQGCGLCRKYDKNCVVEDDLADYFADLWGSDVLVVTAPNYYSHVAGPMITFMNRHYCLFDKDKQPRFHEAKKLYAFFAQGAPEGFERYMPNYEWYTGVFEKFNMNLEKMLICGGNSNVDAFIEAAYQEGKKLG